MKTQLPRAIAVALCLGCVLAAQAQTGGLGDGGTNGLPPYVPGSNTVERNVVVGEPVPVERQFLLHGVATNITVPDRVTLQAPPASIEIVEEGARAEHGRLPVRFSADINSDSGTIRLEGLGRAHLAVRPTWIAYADDTGVQAQNACRRLALSKPGQNQYFYSPTSIGRATGAGAVLWGRQAGQAAGVIPPGYNAALAHRAGSVHRGHLIPNRYGGSGGLENIVTQDATFNLSTIKTSFEHKIDAELSAPNVCKFVCVLNVPAYRGRGATGVMDPGKPVPIGFAVEFITGSSYFSDSVIQPVITGDLAKDIAPWNTWATGDIPLN